MSFTDRSERSLTKESLHVDGSSNPGKASSSVFWETAGRRHKALKDWVKVRLNRNRRDDDFDFGSFPLEFGSGGFETLETIVDSRSICKSSNVDGNTGQEIVDIGKLGTERTSFGRVGAFESSEDAKKFSLGPGDVLTWN